MAARLLSRVSSPCGPSAWAFPGRLRLRRRHHRRTAHRSLPQGSSDHDAAADVPRQPGDP